MIVIVIIISAVAATTKYIYELYEVQTISNEFTMYREAFKKFKAVYNYDAGMVPDAYLTGDINVLSISDATTRSQWLETFRQLALAGLIPKNKVKTNQSYTSSTLSGLTAANYDTMYDNNVYGVILPKASWNSNFHFNAPIGCGFKNFYARGCNNSTSIFLTGRSIGLGFSNTYRTMALLHRNAYLNGAEYNSWTFGSPNAPNQISDQADAGTISGMQAGKLDTKIDDGSPATGWIMANDIFQTFNANDTGCTYLLNNSWYGGVHCKTTPDGISYCYGDVAYSGQGNGGYGFQGTANLRKDITYQNNSKASPKTGCIMFIDISTEG